MYKAVKVKDWVTIGKLKGKTLVSVTVKDKEILFKTTEGETYQMFHSQDCCEDVYIEDIVGDVDDLIGSPILIAQESSNSSDVVIREYQPDSYTWTYYKLATIKGYVDIRWFGESNGFYSESVSFVLLDE